MAVIKAKFSPSINIERDLQAELNYIPTPNAKQIFEQLLSEFALGNRAFNIIGAYGTGKSAFLLALYQSLNAQHNYFPGFAKQIATFGKIEFVELVGDYMSFTEAAAARFGVKYNANFKPSILISAILNQCKANCRKKISTVIAIDEFGKFLEYAAKNSPEQELFFIQQLAELANDEKNNLLLLTTLHQDFGVYAFDLTKSQRTEWDKVKGRLKDITFNEPVEQLLYLASERMSANGKCLPNKDFPKLFNSIRQAKAFPLRDYFTEDIAKKLLPFDILSAAVLTLALQRYGQNERSLFSFLESSDYLGIRDYNAQDDPYYNLACVYDYFAHNYYSFLNSSKSNPHYQQWTLLKKSIERLDTIDKLNEKQKVDAAKLLKTIGLLNIFATASAKLSEAFFVSYARYALGLRGTEVIIEILTKSKVIRYLNHAYKYILFEGSDIDIELAIDEAGNLVERVTNVVHHLQQNFEFPFLLAKREFFHIGTPRYFQFQISENPIYLTPEDEIDGYINLVFTDQLRTGDVKRASENCEEAILFGYFKNTTEIQKLLFEIQKVQKVMELNPDDKVAIRELKGILQHNRNLLNHAVYNSFYNPDIVDWYFMGDKLKIRNTTQFNQQLSVISSTIYSLTPYFKNEMVNKTKLSSQIASARKALVDELLKNSGQENLGFASTIFPPQKTIYLALLKETGIHSDRSGFWELNEPTDEHFLLIWNLCCDFLKNTRTDRGNLQDLVLILSQKPIKLKKGFLDFWLCIFLLTKRHEFALYDEDGNYIPEITSEVLDLLLKKPSNFYVKVFDVRGIRDVLFRRYRTFINLSSSSKISNQTFVQTIKPFLILYRDLNNYGKLTKKLSPKAVALREAIGNATDLEKTFFDDIPNALGYLQSDFKQNEKLIERFIDDLQTAIQEIQHSYRELLNRFETTVQHTLGEPDNFPAYRNILAKRFEKLKSYLLLKEQKTFYNHIMSQLDDRNTYLESIAQACLSKPLNSITDEDESKLHERFSEYILTLDGLCEISKSDIDESSEEVLLLQVSSFVRGISKRTLRVPKTQEKEVNEAIKRIKSILRQDTKTNLSILVKLLQEELENEKKS